MDDLAVSIDVETPELPAEAADLVITTLVRIAAAHHGEVQVLRALSRRERAAVTISAF
jgi:phosphoribosyl-ATP pyrophosphohydrolase